jgi:hypothetical protein
MKLKNCTAALALCSAVPMAMAAAPTCNSTTGWGSLGPPGSQLFGNSFNSVGSYSDCFTFTLASQADSFGGVLEIDPLLNKLDINVKSVALYLGDAMIGRDTSPLLFSFGSLAGAAATYTLQVVSDVSRDWGVSNWKVGYIGKIATVAAPVPEPAAYALAIVGLVVVGACALRRNPR